jgi:hypothetical protein
MWRATIAGDSGSFDMAPKDAVARSGCGNSLRGQVLNLFGI